MSELNAILNIMKADLIDLKNDNKPENNWDIVYNRGRISQTEGYIELINKLIKIKNVPELSTEQRIKNLEIRKLTLTRKIEKMKINHNKEYK